MVSVYAEPVIVEAPHGAVEAVINQLIERSVQRTSDGNSIVFHVERAKEGVALSVEDGRPPEEDALAPDTKRLVLALGGRAEVEPHIGGGAILRVILPHVMSADIPALST
jgi:hypothetical protein